MSSTQRILLALGIVLFDTVAFAIPLTALFIAYVIIARPASVREWVNKLYS